MTSPAPVFVFGALRSGTTVLRLMLNAHPGISNPGEVDFLFDYLEQDESGCWRYDIEGLLRDRIFLAQSLTLPPEAEGLELLSVMLDQFARKGKGVLTLNVHRNISRIIRVLPGARFIHLLRDPRDVARSSIGMGWAGNLYYGVNHWIRTEEQWDEMCSSLPAEHVHTLTYEKLIANVEGELHRICEFIGVHYKVDMLSYHENTTYARPDTSLIEQWRRKSTIHEVGLVEGKAAKIMRARGYLLAAEGITPGYPEKLYLYLQNKLRVWSFGVRRHGASVYFLEKITRRLGMKQRNVRLQDFLRESMKKHLK